MEKYLNSLPGVIFVDRKEYLLNVAVITEITSPDFKEFTVFYKHESFFDSTSEIRWFVKHPSIEVAFKLIYDILLKEKIICEFEMNHSFVFKNELSLN